MISFSLDMPPSVNNLYPTVQTPTGAKRIKCRKYKAWIETAGWQVPPAAKGKVPGRFRIALVLDRVNVSRIDLDGKIKATLDLLKTMSVIKDDSLNEGMTVDWSSPFTAPTYPVNPQVHLSIEPLMEAKP